jgi:hypothetical protein
MSPEFDPRTAISILLDDAAPEVAAARYALDPGARQRVPLHITLLYPFVHLRDVTAEFLASLRSFFAAWPRPAFELARVELFPGVVSYAAPAPDGALVAMTSELWAAYPETPPYDGLFSEPIPHATLAHLDVAGIEAVRARVEPLLPVRCSPTHASLLREFEPDRWRELHALPFAGVA